MGDAVFNFNFLDSIDQDPIKRKLFFYAKKNFFNKNIYFIKIFYRMLECTNRFYKNFS